jgi:hypothetical protein
VTWLGAVIDLLGWAIGVKITSALARPTCRPAKRWAVQIFERIAGLDA